MSDPEKHDAVPGWLGSLEQVPERDSERAAQARQAYMQAVDRLPAPVSAAEVGRHKGWMSKFRKERSPMFSFARILIVLALALGGTGTTAAYAAQSSLPGDPLYGVKLALEDLRLSLTRDPQEEMLLLENMVQTRLNEISALVEEGKPIQQRLMTQLETHLQQALQLSAQLDDPQLIQAMEQIRTRAEIQLQTLQRLRTNAPQDQAEALQQTEQAILRVRNTAQDAIEDPTTFRLRLGAERPDNEAGQQDILPPGQNDDAGQQNGAGSQGPCLDCGAGPNGPNSNGGR